MPFCVAYHRESLEMVLDAHARAFAYFGGSCRRGIYDNLKTVVTQVLLGKDRTFHRRFLQLASHDLGEPVACTPAAGWEKGQVENQVGFIRERVFVPRLKCADLAELNRHLRDRCHALAASQRHPEFQERTVAEVFAAGMKQRRTPERLLLDLLEAEIAERRARGIRYRLGLAKFPVDKDLDSFEFGASPVDEPRIRSLYAGGSCSISSPSSTKGPRC